MSRRDLPKNEEKWRSVKQIVTHGESANAMVDVFGAVSNHHAVEALLDNGWLLVRWQEEPGGEIFGYAVPSVNVSYVTFWPEKL